MPKVFSAKTLGKFEDAAASVPLRPLDRAFEGAGIRLGVDPGGDAGTRKTQFRRYVASIDQRDAQQLEQLGAALGALIEEVATSKQEFLVQAAAADGFSFADGVFRPAATSPNSFAVASNADFASIDERGRRLHVLADGSPQEAIAGAMELVESVCRIVLSLVGAPDPSKKSGLGEIIKSTLAALETVPSTGADAKKRSALVRRCLEQLGDVVADLSEMRNLKGDLSTRYARLAVGAALTLAGFVAETYSERSAQTARLRRR